MRVGRGRVAALWTRAWRWCRRYAPTTRAAALGVIVGLMAAVTVLRWFVDGAGQAAGLLYVVPIALSALRFGRRGGVAAAAFGITAFAALELIHARGDVDVTGWVAPLLTMALMGGLVGELSDSAADHEAAHRLQAHRVVEMRDAQHAVSETNDSIVQQVAAARWMLEAGKHGEALATLDATVARAIAQTSPALPPLPRRPSRDPGTGDPRQGDLCP